LDRMDISMKKIAFALIMVIFVAAGAFADDIFFPSKKGMVLTTATLNQSGKPESFARMTVKDVSGSGANKSITCVLLPLDSNRKPTANSTGYEYTINVVNNVLELDMRSVLASALEAMPQGMPVEITGGKMRLPAKLAAGDKLEDANMKMSVNMGVASMEFSVSVTNHKCVAVEKVTVPAGTFECYKVTQTTAVSSSIMGTQTAETSNSATWYAKGIGSVKTVVYDANGKVGTTTELQEIVR